ncbi:histidinol-phosphatase [Paenibacillus sp. FSL H8-0034]|uniref:histidinol-phosphatase n=1 Tax=Paenibacillus sp. FSL H8-0034 TaxID=2954671 RepID=UPI0030F71DC0
MRFDFHTHHERCGHASDSIRDYVESAIERGLDLIGISDHSPFFASEVDQLMPGIAMAKSEFEYYVAEVLRLKEEYRNKIEVLLGVESDFFPEHADVYRRMYEQYPFDYIIGSVHWCEGTNIFDKKRWIGADETARIRSKESYYELIRQSARSGMFQILGHIDAMRAYCPEFSGISTPAVDETLKVIGECDAVIEVNTSAKLKDCGNWYPTDELLERALYYGVSLTLGSDAHVPDRAGDDFDEVRQRIKDIGFKEWAIFRQKQRFMVPL